ncbi:MAG TPA: hypothetical protein VLH59_05420 [Ignavibacteriaceae bacterium]|nr:hypothetical protein [Ignavibacteriaceae bacterium]
MQTLKSALLIMLLFLSFNLIIYSQGNPIQLSLFNPIQIVPEGQSVNGIRLNLIYTKNANVTGFDLGLVNQTTGSQLGVQWGGVNITDGGFTGWQSAFVNISRANFVGLQTSWVNYHGGHFNGLQFSIVNYAATLEGLQLGLINIIGSGGFLPVFPIFNFDFD